MMVDHSISGKSAGGSLVVGVWSHSDNNDKLPTGTELGRLCPRVSIWKEPWSKNQKNYCRKTCHFLTSLSIYLTFLGWLRPNWWNIWHCSSKVQVWRGWQVLWWVQPWQVWVGEPYQDTSCSSTEHPGGYPGVWNWLLQHSSAQQDCQGNTGCKYYFFEKEFLTKKKNCWC